MPGTGPLRRSSGPARKKAMVEKSQVGANLRQGPAFVFGVWVRIRTGPLSGGAVGRQIGPLEADGLGVNPAQQKPGKPDFQLVVLKGLKADRPPRQTRADKE